MLLKRWARGLLALLLILEVIPVLPAGTGAEQPAPNEEGAPLLLYLRVSVYDKRPYLNFYPASEEEISNSNVPSYFTFNHTKKTYKMPYPRVYMKTLYFRPDNSLGNHLNISYRYGYLTPGTLRASVEVDFEGDGKTDLTYTYAPINLTPTINWHDVVMNLSSVQGEEREIEWGVIRLNLSAELPPGAVLSVACGEEGHNSYLLLPYRRTHPGSGGGGGTSPELIALIIILLAAVAVYVIWDVKLRRR